MFGFDCASRDGCFGSANKTENFVPPSLVIVGSGAREHALARAASRSPQKPIISCFGSAVNPGITKICAATSGTYEVGKITDPAAVLAFVQGVSNTPDVQKPIVIVGPEAPLEAGVTDALENAQFGVVGPRKQLAMLETSKNYTRNLMHQYMIPGRCQYKHFESMDGVEELIDQLDGSYVVKDDGLCGGKGVKVSGDHLEDKPAGLAYCKELIDKGSSFVIEEKLVGEEFSIMSFCDGEHLAHMPAVQDHKRAFEGDKGPNTGGMGSYSDGSGVLPWLTPADVAAAREINEKVAAALLENEGSGYKGVLYGQFMATKGGVNVIEYNARFGDPEALNLMTLLESDLVAICQAICHNTLTQDLVRCKPLASVCKYKVPEGYPDKPVKGQPIDVSAVQAERLLYLASVDEKDGVLVECGSRTAAVVGQGITIAEAEAAAELEVSRISGPLFHRKDIGTAESLVVRQAHMRELRGVHVAVLAGDDAESIGAITAAVAQRGGSVRAVISESRLSEQLPGQVCCHVDALGLERDQLESAVDKALADHCTQLVLLVGWGRKMSAQFTKVWGPRCYVLSSPLCGSAPALQRMHELISSQSSTVELKVGLLNTVDGNCVPECTRSVEISGGLSPEGLKKAVQQQQADALSTLVELWAEGKVGGSVGMTYAQAGVSIDAGNTLVERIKPHCKATRRSGCYDQGIGGFGGLFDCKAAGFEDPIMVACTDGVGTKLKLAHMANKHDTVGIDLVAMSVNDLVVQGAQPLFFLDYFACGKLEVEAAVQVVAGISQACIESDCALIGGETAEMPSMYPAGEYDLAGFAVGAVERGQLLPNMDSIQPGDLLLGLASNGVHSNGFSLVRRIVESTADSSSPEQDPWAAKADWSPEESLLEAFLHPTALYVRPSLKAIQTGKVKALCHITGGGLLENLPRVMPAHLKAELDLNSYSLPGVFKWLQYTGNVANEEMLRTFNCGVGMVIVCGANDAAEIEASIGQTIRLGSFVAKSDDAATEQVVVNQWWENTTYSP